MPESTVLVVEDDPNLAEALCIALQDHGYTALHAADGTAALNRVQAEPVDLVLSDVHMAPMDGVHLLENLRVDHPGMPMILMTAYATVEKAVAAMEAGASTYLVKPFDAATLIETVTRCLPEPHEEPPVEVGDSVVAGDPLTRGLLGLASRVAGSEATVLLSGESGTGKEVFARFIHRNSLRAEAPFVAVNCAAIPENMLEALLFGHEKGAYTGASDSRPGKFEQANDGTLLLDEVSEMPLALQAKLLRVLQEREVERLGGRAPIALDIRVLATTNRNLAAEVRDGRFREDLFYRLNVFPLHIPPLRDRRGDILPLAEHLLRAHCRGRRAVPRLTAVAERCLLQHRWSGNVRELENVIQRTLVLFSGNEIAEADIAFERAPAVESVAEPGGLQPSGKGLQDDLRQAEMQLISSALEAGAGSREAAARSLGISTRTLRHKIARLRDAGLAVPGHRESRTAPALGSARGNRS